MTAGINLQAARDAGYTDDEILEHMSSKVPNFNVSKAKEAGYSSAEILEFINEKVGTKEQKKKSFVAESGPDIDLQEPDEQKPWYQRLYESVGKSAAAQSRMVGPSPESMPAMGEAGRELLSGGTFGFSELIPGMQTTPLEDIVPEERDAMSIIKGAPRETARMASLDGLFKLMNLPAGYVASENLTERAQSFMNLAKSFGVGVSDKSLRDAAKGEFDPLEMLAHGAEFAVLDGLIQTGHQAGKVLKAFFSEYKDAGGDVFGAMERLAKKMQSSGIDYNNIDQVGREALRFLDEDFNKEGIKRVQLAKPKAKVLPAREMPTITAAEAEGNPLALRKGKVTENFFERKREQTAEERPEYAERPEHIGVERPSITEEFLDLAGNREETAKKLGERVKSSVETAMRKSREKYKPAYELAEEAAWEGADGKPIMFKTNKALKRLWDRYQELGSLKTKPPGYEEVRGRIRDLMEDMGADLEMDGGEIVNWIASRDIPVPKAMSIGRRLNEIINYDDIDKSVRKIYKNFNNKTVKQGIKDALSVDEDALEMWNFAESTFGKEANKFNKDAIRKIRSTKFKGEKISGLIDSPSDVEALKEVLSPEEFKSVEREILGQMNEGSYKAAQKRFREIKQYISEDAQTIAEDILLSKKPANTLTKRDRMKLKESWILNQIAKPTKPKELINEWLEPGSRAEIKAAIKGNVNEENIIKYLQEEGAYKISHEVVDFKGNVDYNKLNDLLSSKRGRQMLDEVGGSGTAEWFNQLENFDKKYLAIQKTANKNMERISGASEKVEATRDALLKRAEAKLAKQNKAINRIFGTEKGPKKVKVDGQDVLEEAGSERGKKMIADFKERVRRAKHPTITTIEDLWKHVPENLKTSVATASVMKFGPIKPIIAWLGPKGVKAAIQSPRLRYALKQFSTIDPKNPYELISTIILVESIMEEEGVQRE